MFWRSRPGPSAPQSAAFPQADLLWALGSVSALHRTAFSADLVAREFPGEGSVAKLVQAAKTLGFHIKTIEVSAAKLARLPFPLLVLLKGEDSSDRLALITAATGEAAVLFEGGTNTPKPMNLPDLDLRLSGTAWILAPQLQAANDADAQVGRASGVTRHFGFSWFGPELLRHRKVWRDVLLASLALQLVALATPLFTQAIVDKVVVHRTESTLIAIAAVMAILLVFNAVLSWGRQYLVLHTGNRVDAVLGAAVWNHLLKLPASYFERRPTGVVAARLHAVENIREFVSGAAISMLLDLPFLVICLAVMLSYSALLTALCVAVVLVIALASFLMAPVFQKQLNEQFMLGARNQAFVTEHIAGFETVKTLQMEPQLRQRYSGYLATYLASGFRTKQIGNTYNLANASTAVQALAAGQKVNDVFAYTVADSHGATATAQLTVEITGAADSAGVTLVGTSRDDQLVGTAYADVIDGGKGSDTMAGGQGDDIYFVDVATAECDDDHDDDRDRDHGDDDNSDCNCETGDSIVELAGAGIDTVAASVNYVLPQNVENLMLLGSAALVGTGNNLANVMVASGGPSTLSGAGGNDVLVGRSASDTLLGGSGDDKLYGEAGNDRLDGGQGADRVWGGAGNDVVDGGDGDNLLAGGTGDDTMVSGSGSDVVVTGAGNDKVAAGSGNDFIDAGAGSDTIDGGSGSDFIAAGRGSDTVTSGAGRDVIAFNRGDGQDILLATAGSGSADVLSLGGGIRYADLTLNRRGSDLILGVGAADQITSKNWYAGQDNRSISTLQVVTVGADYNAASTNALLGNKVVAFDFTTITQQYDAARKANASLGIWSLQPALNSAVIGASNTSAIGGDLAFDYATTYSASGGYGPDMTAEVVRKEVKEQTGTTRQAIDTAPAPAAGPTLVDPWVALQAGTDLVVSKAPGASNPITPTNSPTTDSLVLAAMAAGTDVQPPTWAVK